MIDFTFNMNPVEREAFHRRIAVRAAEMERLYALPNRWLGEAILKMVREVRTATKEFASPGRLTYNDLLLWQAVPEVARRLGCRLLPNEATSPDVRGCSNEDLRNVVSLALMHTDPSYLKEAKRPGDDLCPVDMLMREKANGNPVAIALDRVAPPGPESKDGCARHIREISGHRGLAVVSAWYPGMQDYERGRLLAPREEATPVAEATNEMDPEGEAPSFAP